LKIFSLKTAGRQLDICSKTIQGESGMSETKESREQQRKLHIEEMKEQLRQHIGNPEIFLPGGFNSLKDEEAFLEHILFMEGVNEQPLFEIFENGGIALPEPDSMNDGQLHDKLWEVIKSMALLGQYLSSTDHLSDRQLYEALRNSILREPSPISPNNPNAHCQIDILGGCSEEDMLIRLKYYADEEERLSWAEEYPDDIIPPHEPLPYDRDRHLPVPPIGHSSQNDIC
jgi:hypothetical protein